MNHNLNRLNDQELIAAYGDLIEIMKERKMIRTKNIVGDLGESIAIAHYNHKRSLPNLKATDPNSRDFDATDRAGKRYSIKSTSSNRTGAFHFDKSLKPNYRGRPFFDRLIVVMFTDSYKVRRIQEFTWEDFQREKQRSKRQKASFLPLTQKVLRGGKKASFILDQGQ